MVEVKVCPITSRILAHLYRHDAVFPHGRGVSADDICEAIGGHAADQCPRHVLRSLTCGGVVAFDQQFRTYYLTGLHVEIARQCSEREPEVWKERAHA